MLGEHALSAQPLATQSILQFGSQAVSAEFQETTAGTYIGSGEADMSAVAVKVSIGSGILVGLMEATAEFFQSADLTRFATGISAQVFSTVQTTEGTYIASGISEQDAAFIVEAAGTSVLSGVSEQDFEFTQDTAPNMLYSAVSEQIAEFIQSTTGSLVQSALVDVEAVFVQTQNGGLLQRGEVTITAVMIQTTDGRLYWDIWTGSPNVSPPESWTPINPTGGTWTEINAGAIISTWTEKVV